jgi:O-6-methylguanine DNA methyltransferase
MYKIGDISVRGYGNEGLCGKGGKEKMVSKEDKPDLPDYQSIRDMAEQVKAAIDSYYNSKILLSEELSKIGMPQHRMAEIFKDQYGVTPGEYSSRLRLQAAKDMLLQSGEPIAEIALFLGFESLSAFYGFFRKHTQMAPGEYRKAPAIAAQALRWSWYPYETALGRLAIAAGDTAVTAVRFEDMPYPPGDKTQSRLTGLAAKQIEEYAAGKRRLFELPLLPAGTAFQKSVWQALCAIPYGETRSYKQIAAQAGNPSASRAVGMANNKNPIPIIIPCHRVVGSTGALVGYAGGLDMKKRLLDLEAQYR